MKFLVSSLPLSEIPPTYTFSPELSGASITSFFPSSNLSVISHVHYLHLAYFVNYQAVVVIIEYRRDREDRIEHGGKTFLPSHQRIDESTGSKFSSVSLTEHEPTVNISRAAVNKTALLSGFRELKFLSILSVIESLSV
ncbi:MAG: hypothetical protein WAW07_09185 [Bacteroidales bacterium]